MTNNSQAGYFRLMEELHDTLNAMTEDEIERLISSGRMSRVEISQCEAAYMSILHAEHGHIERTLESRSLEPQYAAVFNEEHKRIARERLEDLRDYIASKKPN